MKMKTNLAKIFCFSFALPLLFVNGMSNPAYAGTKEHSHNDIQFDPWTSENELPSEPGNYYLKNDVVLEEMWTTPEGTINLCLDGHVISAVVKEKSDDEIIWIGEDSVLNIYDCNPENPNYFKDETFVGEYDPYAYWIHDNTLTGDDIKHTILGGAINGSTYRGATVADNGVLNMYGGTICMSTAQVDYGGAVWCYGGTFNMYEGVTLTDNYCPEGGAVFVYENDSGEFSGTFNMYGGVIKNNKSGTGGGVSIFNATFNMYDGIISNNISEGVGGGVAVYGESTFTMYDGTIENNTGWQGGGVGVGNAPFDGGTAIMKGGKIQNNSAVIDEYDMGGIGGGVFVLDGCTFKADGGEIVNNDAENAGGGIYLSMQVDREPYYCVAGDTLVTLEDGSTKEAQELKIGDKVRTFDHETGELTSSEIFYLEVNEDVDYDIMTLTFSDDNEITIIGGHSFFNKEENKYVTITPSNYEDYVGKEFYNADEDKWVSLTSGTNYSGSVDSYSIVTKGTINFVTNGMLSCGDELYLALSNIFDFGEDLKYDQTKKESDIATYGLYSFEECQFATRATYDAFNLQYLKVALGKEIVTKEYLAEAAEYQNYIGGGLVSKRCVFLGGDIKVTDNTCGTERNNVFVWDNKGTQKIVIGTGTEEGKNGVKVPTKDMKVGVTLKEYVDDEQVARIGVISINGSADYIDNFFADDETKAIIFKEDHLEIGYAPVKVPTIENLFFQYDGEEKQFVIPASDLYTVEGETSATDVGEYKVKLVLNNKDMAWDNGSSDDVEFTFRINQRVSDVEIVYEGNTPEEKSPVTIVDSDLGVAPDAVLVVKVVKLENPDDIKTTKDALDNENEIADDETIFGCYDAKLLLNNVEIQPDGMLKIKMQIPEELIGKEFRLYHIHAGTEVSEITYNIVEENGFLIFETDKLSQFAFVGKLNTPAPTPDPDPTPAPTPDEPEDDICIVHWFMIATLVIGVAAFIVVEILFNNLLFSSLVSGIALLISIVLALIGKCDVCTVFKFINVLTFDILLFFALFKNRGEKEEPEKEEPKPVEEAPLKEEEKPAEEVKEPEQVVEDNEPIVEESEEDNQPQVSLKDSLAKMDMMGSKGKLSKKFIAEYLNKNYANETELNCRENTTKPAKGQKVGLPLADTHYVKNENGKKCFIYVYEKNDAVLLLVNTSKEYADELAQSHENISRSAFPKSNDKWFSIVLDDSWDEKSVGGMLDRLVNVPKVAVPKLGLPANMPKSFVSDYLKGTYGKEVACNCRDDNAKPAKGHEVGLPLADTHYVKVGKTKKCFMYVYNRDGIIQILVSVDQEYIEKLSKFHKNISQSAFPKSKDQWYSVNLDNSWDKDDLTNLLDYAVKYTKDLIK